MAECCSSLSSSVDEFAEVLKEEERWYQLGIFLGASTRELNAISDHNSQSTCDILMLLIQLYDCLEKKGKSLSWESIAAALRRIDNHSLAEKIQLQYIKPRSTVQQHSTLTNQVTHSPSPLSTVTPATQHDGPSMTEPVVVVNTSVPVIHNDPLPPTQSSEPLPIIHAKEHKPVCLIANEYEVLSTKFRNIILNVKRVVKSENIDLDEIQDVLKLQCGLPPLPQERTTLGAVFDRVVEQCSILNFHVLESIVRNILSNGKSFVKQLTTLKRSVERFKSSANMVELVTLIKSKQTTPTGGQKRVELKLREFWGNFTYKQFEIIVNEIFQTLYDIMTHITVTKGCICVNWIIPDIDTTELVPVLPIEFIRLIGVIYLHIGSKTMYNIEGDGCESIEAAMLQAIELKNTRAIELLLAVGCSPQVATYTDSNTVTNIVNIKTIESEEGSFGNRGGVDHMCILGQNKLVEAIIDPSSEPECSSCSVKDKMIKQLHLEMKGFSLYKEKNEELASENQLLKAKILKQENEMELKDAENILMKQTNEKLIKEAMLKDKSSSTTLDHKDSNESSSVSVDPSKCTAVLPYRRRRLGINTEMKVKVIEKDDNGKDLVTGGSVVRAILTCNEQQEECPVTDNNDGTYTITVIPQQLGQHQLSITVNTQYIQGSPFTLDIVPQRDYFQLNKPVQRISEIFSPWGISFANSGDMFVTSNADHYIHVYDVTSGRHRTQIYAMKTYSDELPPPVPSLKFRQSSVSRGIDVHDEFVYVVNYGSHRIHQLTIEGEFIGTFGEKGSAIGQFDNPHDVKISPVDGKVFVADTYNDRIQVFNPDWSISRVIDGSAVSGDSEFRSPRCIGIDQSGNIHVGHRSSVTVFTSSGQFVRRYGDQSNIDSPYGICIDPSGYSLVTSWLNGSLFIFDSKGTLIRSGRGLNSPRGVSISPVDGSVWVADEGSHRLLKY